MHTTVCCFKIVKSSLELAIIFKVVLDFY